MFKNLTLSLLLCFSFFTSCAQQNIVDFIGEWEGKTTNKDALNLDIIVKKLSEEDAVFTLSNNKEIITKKFKFDNRINLALGDNLIFSGIVNDGQSEINGFMKSKRYLYPAKLYKKGNHFEGKWNLSVIHYLQPQSLRLTIKEGGGSDDEYRAYPILGSLWCNNFKKKNNSISFTDSNTGLEFEGLLKPSEVVLNISLEGNFITKTSFKKITKHKKTASIDKNSQINDGWELSKNGLVLQKMEEGIRNDSLVGIEGVLIAKNGKITYEKYFGGFNVNIPHGMRSASKSISSAIIGIAIDDKIIESVDKKLYDFIPQEYQYTKDALKSKITIKDLLTMSSGLDVNNKAYEEYYQESNNWLKTVLEAPMVKDPGTYADYGSANPFLLGVYLSNRLDVPLEFYMADKLFSPLGITNYILNTDDTKAIPYFGGGYHLTPRDMLKFGQLYLNEGVWNSKRIISENWIRESFKKHTRLQDRRDKNEYGYLWWHDTYIINEEAIISIEARGAGGQFIFIVPALESVVVITAGNYRNRKGNQSREIFEKYILPALLN
ncbi:CubicO group peptidase (beta-lactamase class C family) [Aquimarina sp. EL_43]|uniref:serine hydrolase domain-containing protein n=1 Tax=unclassified Aquimarina TaxID=2627091 RepID=UPI0018C90640|nr:MULTISPECIES: serine hydrolase [unclassified Aquimarina]MBG6129979.1 CubicO group peptidase (beta-lactamase class C family) [Aquimarina sp. EL_35]MBG6148759.1 CubicO group peptidase (beta-lactamase class C family) [Aquimarina sp. EL_32]MBG6168867.1 CubicO group peptidase (beta-lactamase class C family) [Aquimarina sp. EL_43]